MGGERLTKGAPDLACGPGTSPVWVQVACVLPQNSLTLGMCEHPDPGLLSGFASPQGFVLGAKLARPGEGRELGCFLVPWCSAGLLELVKCTWGR